MVVTDRFLRKPTRDITVNIFSTRFFLFPQGFFISARLFLFPQGFFYFWKVCLFPQGFVHFRKVCFIYARLYYFRKIYFVSAMLFLFPRGLFLFRKVGFRNLALANANISTILFEVRKPTRDITVNIFPQGFFLFPQGFVLFPQGYFYFRKVCFITARFVLFISARFCSFPQGLFHFRKVILFPQGLFYFRKVIFISPRFHRSSSQFGSRQCQYLYTIVRSAPLRQMTWAYPYPGGYHWKYFRGN